MNLDAQIWKKAYSSDPSFGTYQHTFKYSQIPRENIFPYPFYFVSNPFSENARVNDRRAGWSRQHYTPEPEIPRDPYPQHCFQPPCNTVHTRQKTEAGCVNNNCIVLDR